MSKQVTVQDIALQARNGLVGGPFGSDLTQKDYTVDGVPVIRGQNLSGGRWVGGEFVFVSEQKANALAANIARPGDIVFTQRGTLGQTAMVPHGAYDRYLLSQSQMKLTVDPNKALPLYVYYEFISPQQQAYIQTNAIRVGVPHTNLGILRSTPINLPSLEEQRRIADILSALDDKIEVNRRMAATLEEIARAIFRAWFVDFLPVRAKASARAEGRDPERAAMAALSGRDEGDLDALPPETLASLAATAALFAEEFTESAMGDVPKYWTVSLLPEVIEVNPRRALKKGAVAPYIDMAALPTNAASISTAVEREFTSGSKFKNGDTLLARITPCLENGKTGYVDLLGEGEVGWGSTEFIVLSSKPPLPPQFAYLLCRQDEFRGFVIAHMTGTSGRQRVPNDCFDSYLLATPSKGVAEAFEAIVSPIFCMMRTLTKQSTTLVQIRDSLLPRLLASDLGTSSMAEQDPFQSMPGLELSR